MVRSPRLVEPIPRTRARLAARTALHLGLTLALAGFCVPVQAQVTASVSGTVADPNGTPLEGVTVTATGEALQRGDLSVTTRADGTYRIAPLPPGVYEISFTRAGFAPHAIPEVRAGVNAELTLDVELRLEAVEEELVVVGRTPRLGLTWDVGGRHRTVVKASAGLFYDRNALTAALGVPDKGGFFRQTGFDVALPRLGALYTDSLIDLVITSGFPLPGGGRTPAENPLYRAFADDLRRDPLHLYRLFGITVADPANPPPVSADNLFSLSGLTPELAVALLEATYPGTDWIFFDVPGGSVVGDRVLSFLPRGPLSVTRTLQRYASDRVPRTATAWSISPISRNRATASGSTTW